MTTNLAPFERVLAFCVRRGVTVRLVDEMPMSIASPFNTSVGLLWDSLSLYIENDSLTDPETIGGTVHELGRLLATRDRPSRAIELNFVGWEWLVAHKLDIVQQWWVAMADYGTGPDGGFGNLSRSKQIEYLRLGLEEGKRYGNIRRCNGQPMYLRRKTT